MRLPPLRCGGVCGELDRILKPEMPSLAPIKFFPGKIVVSPAALKLLSADDIRQALEAHVNGDWGDLGKEDCDENNQALARGRRILSVYHNSNGIKFWIITEADRSATNIFLREIHPNHSVEGIVRRRAKELVRRLNKLTTKPMAGSSGIKLRFCVR
jgi:hypothetical protein